MELMEFLYRVMEELSEASVPIIFKGAMILNLVVQENNPSKVERLTKDIDGDWVGDGPTMEQMLDKLQEAVNRVDATLHVEVYREFAEKKSAGFKIVNDDGEKIASIDLSVRKNEFSYPYISYVNNVSITGASLDKMLSDKLYAVSGKGVCRRVKDLVDIYVMSYITECNVQKLLDIWEQTGRIIGDFSEFRNNMSDIAQAYEKMVGIKNKPDFVTLYTRVSEFIYPFMNLERSMNAEWKKDGWTGIVPDIYDRDKGRCR